MTTCGQTSELQNSPPTKTPSAGSTPNAAISSRPWPGPPRRGRSRSPGNAGRTAQLFLAHQARRGLARSGQGRAGRSQGRWRSACPGPRLAQPRLRGVHPVQVRRSCQLLPRRLRVGGLGRMAAGPGVEPGQPRVRPHCHRRTGRGRVLPAPRSYPEPARDTPAGSGHADDEPRHHRAPGPAGSSGPGTISARPCGSPARAGKPRPKPPRCNTSGSPRTRSAILTGR